MDRWLLGGGRGRMEKKKKKMKDEAFVRCF